MGNIWLDIQDIDIKTIWEGLDIILTVALLVTMIVFIWWLKLNPCNSIKEPHEMSNDTLPTRPLCLVGSHV